MSSLKCAAMTCIESRTEFTLLVLNIERDYVFPRLAAVDHQQLHKVGLALAGVAEDEDIRRGLVLVALVEVREDVAAVSVLADVETMSVSFTGIIICISSQRSTPGAHARTACRRCCVPAGRWRYSLSAGVISNGQHLILISVAQI